MSKDLQELLELKVKKEILVNKDLKDLQVQMVLKGKMVNLLMTFGKLKKAIMKNQNKSS